MKVRGRCHCGEITYEAEVKPGTVNVCHCRDCQMLSGTAFRAGIPAPAESFRVLTGKPREYVKVADSGAPPHPRLLCDVRLAGVLLRREESEVVHAAAWRTERAQRARPSDAADLDQAPLVVDAEA
jgi:hypothetical protein